MKYLYKALTLGATDISAPALHFDDRVGRFITIVGVPSAFLLHGYVGFIFGSIKANPWWSSVLMPIVFLFSAIVSGIAMVGLIYMVTSMIRWKAPDMACLNKLASFLLYAMLIDFSLETLDFIHRLYESQESIHILSDLIQNRLFVTLIVSQVIFGTLMPIFGVIIGRFCGLPDELRRMIYFLSMVLVQVGIFSMRWNVVIGGQLFSKSLRGLTIYKTQVLGLEGLLMSFFLIGLPFVILFVLIKVLPPWGEEHETKKI